MKDSEKLLEKLKMEIRDNHGNIDLVNKLGYEIERLEKIISFDCDRINKQLEEIKDLKDEISNNAKKRKKEIEDINNLGNFKLLTVKYISKEKVLNILKGEDKE